MQITGFQSSYLVEVGKDSKVKIGTPYDVEDDDFYIDIIAYGADFSTDFIRLVNTSISQGIFLDVKSPPEELIN